MASLKARLFIFMLKWTKKKQSMLTAEKLHATIKERRRTSEYRPNDKIQERLDIERRSIQGCPTYIVKPKSCETPKHYVYYLHGGAYTFEIIPPHWDLVADMAEKMQAAFMVPIYPLAPEHNAEAALAYAEEAYDAFTAYAGGAPVHMLGDSAGAGMATALVQLFAKAGKALPKNLLLISPFIDVVLDNPAVPAVDAVDPWLAPEGLREAGRLYADGLDVKDPRISPIYGDLSCLPPTHIYMGTRDILQPDALKFVGMIEAAGGDVAYHEYEGMFHCWPFATARESMHARRAIQAVIEES